MHFHPKISQKNTSFWPCYSVTRFGLWLGSRVSTPYPPGVGLDRGSYEEALTAISLRFDVDSSYKFPVISNLIGCRELNMNYYRYLPLSKSISFQGVVFTWLELTSLLG